MSIRSIPVVLLAALACGCTSLDFIPREGGLVSGPGPLVPVTIQLAWPSGGLGMGPDVWVDGTRLRPSDLTLTSSASDSRFHPIPTSHTPAAS